MKGRAAHIRAFRHVIRRHYRIHGRDLPWRRTRNPYQILVSEIMLQQTQVARVVPKYAEFLKRFPTLVSLAAARRNEVLRVWQGLGYNRRALHLKRLAEKIMAEHDGKLPKSREALEALPGVGPSTAGAMRAFAFDEPAVFLETNIRRTFLYFFFRHRRRVRDSEILKVARETLDHRHPREWYWALMDYGAMLSALPRNPNRQSVRYRPQSSFRGSNRELRGQILKFLLHAKTATKPKIANELRQPGSQIARALRELEREGFLAVRGTRVELRT